MPVCASCGTDNPEIAKFCLACGSPLASAPPPQEVRKVVTIVFSDLKGSTSMGERLDSESLREVMTRYFDSMRAELEHHGGVVEKFIGDAVMAVFGLPTLHEDDALRAVRAAAGMQRALEELNDELDRHWGVRLANRTGVNTGQVISGDPTTGQRLVTGDAVNVAARLEQAAGQNEVLLGELTHRLVRDYVDVEPVEPLELKGKADPVPAFRLRSVLEDTERPRRLDAPMVGRERELETLRDALRSAVGGSRCELATVIGEAGVGKSRLVEEFMRDVEPEATVLRGRCLPYGDGITFWPLSEAVRQAAAIVERDSADEARRKLCALVDDSDVVARVESAIGLKDEPFPVQDLAWASRKLLEGLAAERPLVVVFDDVHWAEATFLELVEHVAESGEGRLLIICSTRRELLERLPEWSSGERARRIELEPLTADETSTVAEHLLGSAGLDDRVRERVVEAAEGNPLFVEQLLSMFIDEGLIRFQDGCWRATGAIEHAAVPPTIQALLASRLDRLSGAERTVIEPAAVIGQTFVRDAVRHLTADTVGAEVGAHLATLTDKQFVQPDTSRPAEEDPYRFHHILIRDTTYDGVLKRARATFHERFVEWADGVNREGAVEYEEILGYHLEQAHRYLSELGPLDERGRALGEDAARRLASAGGRAFARGDVPAAANLYGRAAAVLPEDAPARLELLPEYGEALLQTGRFDEAVATLEDAIRLGNVTGADGVVAHASLVLLLVKLRSGDTENWRAEAAETVAEAMAVFEVTSDHAGMAKAWRLLAWTHGTACRYASAAEASERALEQARLAGDSVQERRAATAFAAAAMFGPTRLADAIVRCEDAAVRVTGDRHDEATVLSLLASLLAMDGSFERARAEVARALAVAEELGMEIRIPHILLEAWRVEMLAGDPVAAESMLRRAYELLARLNEKYFLPTVAGLLAQTLYVVGRHDEIELLGATARDLAGDDDIDTQALWRCVLAKHRALDGAFKEAEAMAREALTMLDPTDALLFKYGALLDLAEVQRLAGDDTGARSSIEAALDLAEIKGSPVMVAGARSLLAAAVDQSLTA